MTGIKSGHETDNISRMRPFGRDGGNEDCFRVVRGYAHVRTVYFKLFRKWLWWAFGSIGLAMAYLASAGPVCYVMFRWEPQSSIIVKTVKVVYFPVIELCERQMFPERYTDCLNWCGNRGREERQRAEEAAKPKVPQ